MNRGAPMKRTSFRRKLPAHVTLPLDDDLVVTIERIAPRLYRVPAPSAPVFASTPKFPYVRNAKLIEAYRLIPCQFCGYWAKGEIVGAHSNWSIHGKGKSVKATDTRCASACPPCHHELDQGKTWSEADRREKWWDAHVKTIRRLVAANYWPATVEVPDTSTFPKEWAS
jgi:hypothetical protein